MVLSSRYQLPHGWQEVFISNCFIYLAFLFIGIPLPTSLLMNPLKLIMLFVMCMCLCKYTHRKKTPKLKALMVDKEQRMQRVVFKSSTICEKKMAMGERNLENCWRAMAVAVQKGGQRYECSQPVSKSLLFLHFRWYFFVSGSQSPKQCIRCSFLTSFMLL